MVQSLQKKTFNDAFEILVQSSKNSLDCFCVFLVTHTRMSLPFLSGCHGLHRVGDTCCLPFAHSQHAFHAHCSPLVLHNAMCPSTNIILCLSPWSCSHPQLCVPTRETMGNLKLVIEHTRSLHGPQSWHWVLIPMDCLLLDVCGSSMAKWSILSMPQTVLASQCHSC